MLIFLKSYQGIKYLSWVQILFDTSLPSNPFETASIITSLPKSTPTDIPANLSYFSDDLLVRLNTTNIPRGSFSFTFFNVS